MKGIYMITHIGHICILVKDQKEARDFYVNKLGFVVVEAHEDGQGGFMWLVVAPKKDNKTVFTLMRPTNKAEEALVGKQSGQVPFAVLVTDDCRKDAAEFKSRGVKFVKEPTDEFWGVDAVFADLYGNLLDLCQPKQR